MEEYLEEKLKILISDFSYNTDYILISMKEHTPKEKIRYNYMADIYDNCINYIEINYVPYLVPTGLYKSVCIEYNGTKYNLTKMNHIEDNGEVYTNYMLGKVDEATDTEEYTWFEVPSKEFRLSIKGNSIITRFESDKIINDTKEYFESKKGIIKLLTEFRKCINDLYKIGMSKKGINELINYTSKNEPLDESSMQYQYVLNTINSKCKKNKGD